MVEVIQIVLILHHDGFYKRNKTQLASGIIPIYPFKIFCEKLHICLEW
jgi:hypothetical protein